MSAGKSSRRPLIEKPGEFLRFYGVDEGVRVYFPYGVNDLFAFVSGNHGIDKAPFAEVEGAFSFNNGGSVP